ncbi:hypothetical protein SAMN05216366_11257, partial [Selenomonas ruminantium]
GAQTVAPTAKALPREPQDTESAIGTNRCSRNKNIDVFAAYSRDLAILTQIYLWVEAGMLIRRRNDCLNEVKAGPQTNVAGN